jgi:hypothetical protein
LQPCANGKKKSADGRITGKGFGLFRHANTAGPFRRNLECGIETVNQSLSYFATRATMAKMDQIQKRNPFEFSNQVDACDRLCSESLVRASKVSDTGDGRTMNANFDEIGLANCDDRDGMPVVSTYLTNAENIACREKAVLDIITKFLESMGTHRPTLEATDFGSLVSFNWNGQTIRGNEIKDKASEGIDNGTWARLCSAKSGGGRN